MNSRLTSYGTATMFGGGDPDRTGDPRLMSPLLCQLSYTATSKALACGGTQFYPRKDLSVHEGTPAPLNGSCQLVMRTTAMQVLADARESVFDEATS